MDRPAACADRVARQRPARTGLAMARHHQGPPPAPLRFGRLSGARRRPSEGARAQSWRQRRQRPVRSSLGPDHHPDRFGPAHLAGQRKRGFALLAVFGLSGRCVSTDAASVLISASVSEPGSRNALDAIFPVASPDLSFLVMVSSLCQWREVYAGSARRPKCRSPERRLGLAAHRRFSIKGLNPGVICASNQPVQAVDSGMPIGRGGFACERSGQIAGHSPR